MSSLLSHFEIFPQKKAHLKKFLLEELKKGANWKENRSDLIEDQCKYYQTYFGKSADSNLYISKDILSYMLKESEKCHHHFNYEASIKTKFVEIDQWIAGDSDNADGKSYMLIFYDSDDSKLIVLDFFIGEKDNDISFDDFEEFHLNCDSKVIDMKIFHKSESENWIMLLDLYSIYALAIIKNNSAIQIKSFDKVIMLDTVPNCFLSSYFIENFFSISQSRMESNNQNWITLFDSTYSQVHSKNILLNDKIKQPMINGEFFNHPSILFCHNLNQVIVCDFRTKNPCNKILIDNERIVIDQIKYLQNFKFLTFSSRSIGLFDSRYPSLPVSETQVNINYKGIEIKEIQSTYDRFLIGIDRTRKDHSHLLFQLNEFQEDYGFFQDFLNFRLIKNDRLGIEIHDTCNILINENLYGNFIVDNLGGLFFNTYALSENFPLEDIQLSRKFLTDTYADHIPLKTLEDDLTSLHQQLYLEQFFSPKKNDISNVKEIHYTKSKQNEGVFSEDDLYESISDEDEDDDNAPDEVNFGYAKVNGKKKQMYKIQNKRSAVEKLLTCEYPHNKSADVLINSMQPLQFPESHEITDDEEVSNLKFLIDSFNIDGSNMNQNDK